jgi:hypothetical protein
MPGAFKRPNISRDISELIPTEVLGQIYGSPRGIESTLMGAPDPNFPNPNFPVQNFGNSQTGIATGQRPTFDMGQPELQTRTATTRGVAPGLAFLADFLTSFGAGPQAAANQQQRRYQSTEDFFDREQQSANQRSGQTLRMVENTQRGQDRNEANQLRMAIAQLQQQGQTQRLDTSEKGKEERLDKTLTSRESVAEKNRQAARDRVGLMISAMRGRQASSQAHSSLMQNERLSQQERLNLGAKRVPLRELEGQIGDVLGAFEAAADEVSPTGSAIGSLQMKTGGLLGAPSETFSALSTQLAQLKNQLLKIRSGAAVVDQEFRRIGDELPVLGGGENARWFGDNADVFRQKLELSASDVQRTIALWGQVSSGGSATPPASGSAAAKAVLDRLKKVQ